MTTNTALRVYQGALSATLTTPLAAMNTITGAAVPVLVKNVVIANSDSVARSVTLYGGVSAGVSSLLLPAVSIPANTCIVIDLNVLLNAGESVFGGASAASVVGITITGVKFV